MKEKKRQVFPLGKEKKKTHFGNKNDHYFFFNVELYIAQEYHGDYILFGSVFFILALKNIKVNLFQTSYRSVLNLPK